MRVTSRFCALLAVCALTASVAACGDAPSPTAAADATARQGRMLQPGEASKVMPGDFIVYRPEEYKKWGISTFSASAAAPSAAYYGECNLRPYEYDYIRDDVYDDGCGGQVCYDVNGGQIPCGNDPCYDRYGNYLCGQPTCHDAYGNVITCGDPCYNSSGYYVCGQSTVTAQYNYGSSAPYDGWVNSGGVLLKQVRLISFSQSIANVASFSVDAVFKNVGAGSGYGCNNTAQAFDYASAYGTGSGGYVEVSRVAQWNGTIKFQVDGTHTFNPVSGATGGGTFYTSSNFCG